MLTTGEEGKFQLTIRCAMQSFSDYTVECKADWSILQLKEHLSQICSSKPEPSRQRLIYAGRCLDNDQKVRDVLAQRRDGIVRGEVAEKQVIHMVHIGSKNPTTANNNPRTVASSEGLRHRGGSAVPNSANVITAHQAQNMANQNQPTSPMLFSPQQQQYNFHGSPNQQQASYEDWMAAYQNYVNQMMHYYQQQISYASGPNLPAGHQIGQHPQMYGLVGTARLPFAHQQQPGAHHPMLVNGQQLVMPMAQQQPAPIIPGGGGMGAAEMGAAIVPDFLDIVYKSIRFVLLAMILYLYSSLERFFFVLAIVALFWFVHRRRDHDQQRNENGQQPQGRVQRNENVGRGNGDDEEAEDPQNQRDGPQQNAEEAVVPPVQPNNALAPEPSAWNVFFTVVQSFFTSLVPNPAPAPLDIN